MTKFFSKQAVLSLALLLFSAFWGSAFAQNVGDFRTNGDVSFLSSTNWQRYDGTSWVAASGVPTSANGVIYIRGSHTATVSSNVTLDQVVVEGRLQVNNGVTLTLADGTGTDLLIVNRIIFEGTGKIAGSGQFVLGKNAILYTANVGGVAASIMSTNPTLTAGASYWFNGTTAQSTGFTGFASLGNPLRLSFSNTAGVTIDRNLIITGTLDNYTNVPLTIGAGVTSFTASAIYNGGTINNCVGANITPSFTHSSWVRPKGIYQSSNGGEPITESSNILTNSHKTTAHIYWLYNGSGNNRIVVLKAGSPVNANAALDNTTYTANTAFGSGTPIDGGFVVYNGAGSQVNVTGLTEGITYHVAVFEYNQDCSGNRNYKTGSPQSTSFVASERPFITEWITTDGAITIPTVAGETYSYNVSYRQLPSGVPTVLTGQTGSVTLTGLINSVTYEVSITGTFPRIAVGALVGNGAKIRNIKQWGSIQWTSMNAAFSGCTNLTSNATDVPNLSNVTSLSTMFMLCKQFNGNLSNWNTSNITDMSSLFAFSGFNQPIGNWDTSKVITMAAMFKSESLFPFTRFNQYIGNWNTGSVISMMQMFNLSNLNQDIGNWNTRNVVSMEMMFEQAAYFNQNLASWNTSNVNNMKQVFSDATNFNQSLATWNISAIQYNSSTDAGGMSGMLIYSRISSANYDATLIGWAEQGVPISNRLGAQTATYCASVEAHNLLISKGWWIQDTYCNINPSVTSLNSFTSCFGTPSAEQTYTIGGTTLGTNSLTITAPTGFEISLTSGTGFTNTLVLTPSSGTINTTTIYVRQTASATNGLSGAITHVHSNGQINVRIPTSNVNAGMTFSPANLPFGTTTAPYNQIINISGGTPNYRTLNVTGLPPLLTATITNATTGEITISSGMNTGIAEGFYNIAITVSDVNCTKTVNYTLAIYSTGINMTLNPATLPNATLGVPYSSNLITYDYVGITPITFTSNLSNGLGVSLNINPVSSPSSGSVPLIGTPTTSGTFNFTITATNALNETKQENYTIRVCPNLLQNLPNVFIGEAYNYSAASNTGVAPYTYSLTGNIPTGTTFNATTGAFTGVATTEGTYNFAITATDAANCPVTKNYSISVKKLGFVTTWKTTDGVIPVSTVAGLTYNFDISWRNLTNPGVGEGSANNQTSSYVITNLENNSTYEVNITGIFPRMFINNYADKLKIQSIKNWGDIVWSSMESAFENCTNLTYTATDAPNLSNVTNMSRMFRSCRYFNGNIGNWNTQNVTDMSFMFSSCYAFNQPIGNWDTQNVTNMNYMFSYATAFNQPIGNWNTSSVTNMSDMFSNASAFNQPIGNWNTSAVTSMSYMFSSASAFNQPIGTWNISNVTSMHNMFANAEVFNQPIGTWNTINVTDMSSMFYYATAFNQPIGNWNTQNVTDMNRMFQSATAFNQDISSWDTENVTDMDIMFYSATAFNQSLATWNITEVGYMSSMLSLCGMNTANYDATLIGWASQNVKTNVSLDADGMTYCNATAARNTLVAGKDWVISGDGSSCINLSSSILSAFSSCSGVASVAQSYTVSGINLTADIVITAPTHFEVSITSPTAGFATSQTLMQSGGNVASTTVYVRQTAGAANNASGNITHTSTNMLTQNVSIPTSTVLTGCVVITSFTPTTAGIDAVITITGTNFTGATAVTIGGQAARSFTVVNSTTITAVTNNNIANGDVTVTNGTTATLAGFTAAIVPNGTITGATFETAGGFKVLRVVVTPATPTQFKQALRYREVGATVWNNLTFDATATSADIQGIAENKTYEIFLQTVSSAGHWSNRSAIFTSTNSGTGNFCSPTVAATAGIAGTTITFNWTAQANATRYLVRYWEVNALGNQVAGSHKTVYVDNGTANNVVVQGLKPTTNYAYDVQVYCGSTTATNRSNVITFTTGAGIACAAPSTVNFVQTTLDGYAALDATWSGATSVTTGSPKYQLRYKTTAGTSWSYWNTDATNYTMTGLEPNTQYDFQIAVFCNGGGAEWSSLYTPMTGAAPNSCPLVTLGASTPFSQAGGIVGANLVWTGIAPTAGRRFFLGYTKDGESFTVWRWIESNGVTVRSDLDYPNLIASSNYSYILQTYCNTWNFAGYAIGSPGTFTTGAATSPLAPEGGIVNANVLTNELVIYPNPSEGEVTIQTLQGFGNLARLELSVIDVLGREVYSHSFNGSVSVKLDGKTLRSGVYVAKVMENGKVMTKKFVVK